MVKVLVFIPYHNFLFSWSLNTNQIVVYSCPNFLARAFIFTKCLYYTHKTIGEFLGILFIYCGIGNNDKIQIFSIPKYIGIDCKGANLPYFLKGLMRKLPFLE